MLTQFQYYMPTRIIFGSGCVRELATTPHLPGKKALIVTSSGPSMKQFGYLEKVIGYLRENGVDAVVFDKIIPNPIAEHVAEGAAMAKAQQCDFVLGLGGGSSIDSAKSIAVMAKNPGEYWDYIHGGSGKGQTPEHGALPIVAITTTAGTGTEADPWTVITKTDTNEKIGWGADFTFPALAIVDPELMLTVPPAQTAYQGMDAFFHAVEGYLATSRQPASDFYALEAIRLAAHHLPTAVQDGQNLEARTALAWANTAAGIVESLSSCISHHSLEHAISAYHPEVPHGAGLTLTSVAYFGYLAERHQDPARFCDMARAMGEDVDALPEADQPFAFITALRTLIERIGLKDLRLTDFGVTREEARTLAQNSFDTMGGLYQVNPVELSVDDVVSIIERCFG